MERLTEHHVNKSLGAYMVCSMTCDNSICRVDCREISKIVDRLAAYEDIGMEPEEVLTGKELAEIACFINLLKEYQGLGLIDHLRELAEAEKDRKLVVHGMWVESDIPGSMLSKCTVCGFRCGSYTFNFCPNCGAKMDLSEAELKKREEEDDES